MPTHHCTDGVAWTANSLGMIKVGSNPGWPRDARFSLRVTPGDGFAARAEAKMRAHAKWPGLVALTQGAITADAVSSSAASAAGPSAEELATAPGCERREEESPAEREPGAAGGAGAQADGAGAGAGQAASGDCGPAETEPERRRSARSSAAPTRFIASDHAMWSAYDTSRAGSEHARVREVSYDELTESLASTEDAVRAFLSGMSDYCEAAAGNAAEHIAIAHIQYVLLQVLNREDVSCLVFLADTAALQPGTAVPPAKAPAGTGASSSRTADPTDASSETEAEEEEGAEGEAEIEETWLSALAELPQADQPRWMCAVHVNGTRLTAVLHRGQLLLGDAVGLEPTACHTLRGAKIKLERRYRASPFAAPVSRVELTLTDGTLVQFDVPHGGGGLGAFEEVYACEAAFIETEAATTSAHRATLL